MRVRGNLKMLLAGLVVTAACSDTNDRIQRQDLVVYEVVHGPVGSAFWSVFRKGVQDAAKVYEVDVRSLAEQQFSISKLVDNIERATVARPDGLVVTITDHMAVDASLRRAIDKGIAVIAVNVSDPRPHPERIPYLLYIGSDERQGAIAAANRVLQEKTPKHVLCLIQEAGHAAIAARCDAFAKTMEAAGATTDIITIPGGNPTQSAETIRGYFKSHPDTDVTFAPGPQAATPAMEVVRQLGIADQMTLVAFGLKPDIVEAIKDGTVLATMEQQQYLQGYLAVQFLAFHTRYGFCLGADIDTGPILIDASNVGIVEKMVTKKFR